MSVAGEQVVMKGVREKMWLVKVPRFLQDHLTTPPPGGGTFGTLRRETAAGGAGAGGGRVGDAYRLELSDTRPNGLPREYNLRFTTPPPGMYVLSMAENGAGVPEQPQLEGRVEAKGDLRPVQNEEYRQLLKERDERAAKTTRMGVMSDDDASMRPDRLNHRQVQRDEKLGKEKRQLQREAASSKRAKVTLSGRELRDKLFELFDRQTHWQKPHLLAATGNAAALQKFLDENCVKVTAKGPKYGDYRLKDSLRSGLPSSSKAE